MHKRRASGAARCTVTVLIFFRSLRGFYEPAGITRAPEGTYSACLLMRLYIPSRPLLTILHISPLRTRGACNEQRATTEKRQHFSWRIWPSVLVWEARACSSSRLVVERSSRVAITYSYTILMHLEIFVKSYNAVNRVLFRVKNLCVHSS